MRILYVIHALSIGGAETLLVNYLVRLKEMGVDVSVLQINDLDTYLNKNLVDSGIPVYKLFMYGNTTNVVKKIYRKLFLGIKLNKKIRQINSDIIHFHDLENFDRCRCQYDRCFFTFHTSVSRVLNARGKRYYNRYKKSIRNACKKGTTLVALSREMFDDIQNEVGPVKTVIIPNGIDVELIQKQRCNRSKLCEEIKVPVDSFILGHVGRYHPVKNHEKIIDIFNVIHKKQINSYLILIGRYEQHRKQEIDERIGQYGLQDYVIQMGIREDAKKIMSLFDCFILPSYVEGFSLVFAEAQALGIRSIATSSVPNEVLVNDNAFKLDINLDDSVWADYILGDFEEKRGRDIMELDISVSVGKCLKAYEEAMR